MRTADGLVLLREIVQEGGSVEIGFFAENRDDPWTIGIVGQLNHEHGPTLERTIERLWDQLERVGVVPAK